MQARQETAATHRTMTVNSNLKIKSNATVMLDHDGKCYFLTNLDYIIDLIKTPKVVCGLVFLLRNIPEINR